MTEMGGGELSTLPAFREEGNMSAISLCWRTRPNDALHLFCPMNAPR